MTDRKPDFYCVREIILGSRRWLRIPVEHRSEVGPWSTKEVGKALQFDTHAEACVELDKLRQYTGGKYSPRIVPVYVKVTRKPKRYHGIAWAAKQDQLGKLVVCDDVVGAPTYQTAIRVMMRSRKWRFANDGETYGTV